MFPPRTIRDVRSAPSQSPTKIKALAYGFPTTYRTLPNPPKPVAQRVETKCETETARLNPQSICGSKVDSQYPNDGDVAVKLLVAAKLDVLSRHANARFRWGLGHREHSVR